MVRHLRAATPRRRLAQTRMALDPAAVWSAYEAATESQGLLTDMLTCVTINFMSDSLAQLTERLRALSWSQFDGTRTARLSAVGFFDGAVSHGWFEALDGVVGDGQGLAETAVKTAADALVYTPLWCVWFLAFMAVLEGRGLRTVPGVVRSDWLELFRGNLGFFLPLTGLIYGLVPRQERVLAFAVASLVYTTILSVWNNARQETELELCSVDDPDPACEPMPQPPIRWPRAAVLPYRARRVLVSARRITSRERDL